MKNKTLMWVFVLTFAIGVVNMAATQTAWAQNDKPRQEKEDDEDDDRVSPEEARSVKVPLESARAIALAKVSGKIIDEELEKERGRLQYAFDIKDAEGNVFDIEVDALTGEVLQVVKEDDDDDDDDDDTATITRKKKKKVKTAEKTAKVVTTKPN